MFFFFLLTYFLLLHGFVAYSILIGQSRHPVVQYVIPQLLLKSNTGSYGDLSLKLAL